MTFTKVAEVIAERTGKDTAEIKPEMTFEELDLDSLDTVDMLMGMEDIFGVTIELNDDMKTVGDVVKYIDDAAGEKK